MARALALAMALALLVAAPVSAGKPKVNGNAAYCGVGAYGNGDFTVGSLIDVNVGNITPRGATSAIVYFTDQGALTVQRVDSTDAGPPYGDNGSWAYHYSNVGLAYLYVQPDPGLHLVTVTSTTGGYATCTYTAH